MATFNSQKTVLNWLITAYLMPSIFSGCVQNEEKSEQAKDAKVVDDKNFPEPDVDEDNDPSLPDTPSTFDFDPDKIFLDKMDSNSKAVIKECSSHFGFKSSASVPWPKELKEFLGKELKKLNIAGKILKHVAGIYLMDTTGAEGYAVLAGVVCGAEPGILKVPVVMDLSMMTTDRKKFGSINKIVKYLTYEKGQENTSYIVGHNGDFGFQTLIHELMHVYELVYIPNSGDKKLIDAHKKAQALSWKNLTEDKHGVFDEFGLTSVSPTAREPTQAELLYECSKKRKQRPLTYLDAQEGLSLDEDPFKRDSSDGKLHKFLIEKTSFINQYSSTNATEDFAEAFTIYYTGTRYKDWPENTYYEFNSADKRSLVFKFDAKTTVSGSKLHRKKMCTFAEYVLGETCSKYLD